MFTNTKTWRSVATRDLSQAEHFDGGTPGLRMSQPTHGMAHQPFIDPAGTVAPVHGWVEGSIR